MTNLEERWKPVVGYETEYLVSSFGHIFSLHSNKLLQLFLDRDGYFYVNLSKDNEARQVRVHRIVATAFISYPHPDTEVNHIDGNPIHNAYTNLEWISHTENMKHARRNGLILRGEDTYNAKITPDIVRQIRKDRETGIMYKDLSKKYNLSPSHISMIVSHKRWAHVT